MHIPALGQSIPPGDWGSSKRSDAGNVFIQTTDTSAAGAALAVSGGTPQKKRQRNTKRKKLARDQRETKKKNRCNGDR